MWREGWERLLQEYEGKEDVLRVEVRDDGECEREHD